MRVAQGVGGGDVLLGGGSEGGLEYLEAAVVEVGEEDFVVPGEDVATDAVGATFGEVDVVLALEEGAGISVEGDADFASCTEVLQEEGEELVEAVDGGLQVVLEEDVDGALYGVPLASDDGAWLGALVFGVHL